MKTRFLSALVLALLWCSAEAWAQQYFKLFEKLDKPYEQKIARFSNGDIVLGGSPITGETADQNGGLNLTRLDQCGKVRWAMNYQWKKNYMVLKDIVVNEAGDIVVYGSAYESGSEYIFLLKLSGKGRILTFRVVHPGTVDHFTYNIDLRNNNILAYGLLLNFNTSKRGFVLLFDDKLNYKSGKVFEPFESSGEAIITNDGGFLCRSGFFLVKLNAQGGLQWATTFESETNTDLHPVVGPVAVSGGYLFEASSETAAFFYKLDENGKLVWKSKQFPAPNHAADLLPLPDGNVLVAYDCPGMEENYPCQLLLSPDGELLQQRKLVVDQSLQTASLHQSLGKNRTVSVVGSTDIRAARAAFPSGFVLQFALDSLSGKCFEWEPFESAFPNETPIGFTPLDLAFFDPALRNVEADAVAVPREFAFTESCELVTENIIRKDTLLKCGATWQIRLPGVGFEWEDEVTDNPRTLAQPGTYRASNNDCISPLTYEYQIAREPCQCNVFLPTAFSPNYDGQNDKLELFSNCNIQEVQISIYNRWGDKLFESNAPDASWNGMSKQKLAEAGIYIAVIRYQLLNDSNEMQEGSLVQNITLVR